MSEEPRYEGRGYEVRGYEVRGDNPATGTTETSGRVSLEEARAQAQAFRNSGHVRVVIVDHATGAETAIEGG